MNRLSSLFLTIAALLAALAADAQHVDVAPRRIEVGFNKTVHILFPSPVTYIDIGSMDIIAGKAAGAENVVRVKAAVRDFPKETNLTVITEDGGYYSFDARYAENPQALRRPRPRPCRRRPQKVACCSKPPDANVPP